jgi:hypothetical protein
MKTFADLGDHIYRKNSRVIFPDDFSVFLGKHIVELVDVDPPYHRVSGIHHFQVVLGGGKMESNGRRVTPVQQSGGKSVMLAEDHLVPDRILDGRFLKDRVFGKVEQHGRLQKRALVFAVPAQAGGQSEGCIGLTSIDEEVPMPAQIRAIILFGDHKGKVLYSGDLYILDHGILLCEII